MYDQTKEEITKGFFLTKKNAMITSSFLGSGSIQYMVLENLINIVD
jgi:hypothetical protein